MEEDEDDFYGGEGRDFSGNGNFQKLEDDDIKDEGMDVSDDQEGDEDDSDDDVQFTLEKPPDAVKSEPAATSRTTRQQAASQEKASSTEASQARASPPVKQEQGAGSASAPHAIKGALTHDGKEGKDFPEFRNSKVDVNTIPIWPATGKPITEVDLDADIAETSRLWRLPGTDQTDFFNYGFDEYTWAQYCLRQQTMASDISDQKQQDAQMKAMFGGGGGSNGGANAGMPPGMPPMPPGMPSPEEFFQQMMSSGMNPNDQNQFMQMMMNGGMPGMPTGPSNQQQGGGGFGQQGGGYQNANSPLPQSGQGFQPPSGPAMQGQQGDQGGMPPNMEHYSPQQIAIMQQQQGGMGGQGGGRRGGRRGRGYY